MKEKTHAVSKDVLLSLKNVKVCVRVKRALQQSLSPKWNVKWASQPSAFQFFKPHLGLNTKRGDKAFCYIAP